MHRAVLAVAAVLVALGTLAVLLAGGWIQLIAILAGYDAPRPGDERCIYNAMQTDSIPFLAISPAEVCRVPGQ